MKSILPPALALVLTLAAASSSGGGAGAAVTAFQIPSSSGGSGGRGGGGGSRSASSTIARSVSSPSESDASVGPAAIAEEDDDGANSGEGYAPPTTLTPPEPVPEGVAWSPDNDLQTTASRRRRHSHPKSFATKCATLYSSRDGSDRALSPPVYFGSTFLLDDADHGARLHAKREAPYTDGDGFVYSRWGSPTNEAAALQIAALEGVDDPETGLGACLLFNSGMSAISASLTAVLRAGDHVVAPFTVYGGTHEFLNEFAVHWGVTVTFVDATGPDGPANYAAAFRDNTKVVYAETPANPTCRLTDLAGVGRAVDDRYGAAVDTVGTHPADRARPWVMVDGTFATPYHQRVLDIPGVDVSIHSATKYLGGHSDILAGSVTSRSEPFLHGVSKVQKLIAAPLNPMDSFLLARGLRTLDVRMQRHGENAMAVARMLDDHPMVAEVYYPGLTSHPDREMADSTFRSGRDCEEDREYMPQTYGGMISFVVTGEDDDEALRRARIVCENLRVINLAVSLGGVESLCEHPASMTHAMIPKEQRMKGGLKDGLIRISVGLERARDLVEDLRNSLDMCDDEGCGVPEDL